MLDCIIYGINGIANNNLFYLIEEISQNAKPMNYDDFITLFKQVDFQDKELRASIEAKIKANDDYLLKSSLCINLVFLSSNAIFLFLIR